MKYENLKQAISEALIDGFKTALHEFNPEKYKKALFATKKPYTDQDAQTLAKLVIRKMHLKEDGMDDGMPFCFFIKKDAFGRKEAQQLPHLAHSNEMLIRHFLMDARHKVETFREGTDKYCAENDCFLYIVSLFSTQYGNEEPHTGFLLHVSKDPETCAAMATLYYQTYAFDGSVKELAKEAKKAGLIRIPFQDDLFN